MPSSAYSVILFRSVRTDIPSKRAEIVRLPWVFASVSKIRSLDVFYRRANQPPSETAARGAGNLSARQHASH
jgi:hypothetical protein